MNKALPFTILIIGIALLAPVAVAQSCEMYTYSDIWYDETGAALVNNFTDGNASCGSYSAYSDVSVSVVGGNSYYSNAFASCCAESTVLVPAGDQIGDEYISGDNQITYAACGGPELTDSFAFFYTKVTLLVSSCTPNPTSGVTELRGTWSKAFGSGCTQSDQTPVSVTNEGCNNDSTGRACYGAREGNCIYRYCVGNTRQLNCDTLRFGDRFPIERIDACLH